MSHTAVLVPGMLAWDSFLLAGGVSAFALLIGVSAAYAFSRFKFPGRQWMMIAVLGITVLPAVATIAPLFALLNSLRLASSLLAITLTHAANVTPKPPPLESRRILSVRYHGCWGSY